MIKKSGAVLLWLGLGLFLSGTWGTPALAQENSASETPAADAAPAPASARPFQAQVDQRLAALKTADLEALKQAKEECEKAAKELATKGPALRQAARAAYEDARLNSAEAKEIYRQIEELRQKMDQTLRELPAVKAKQDEVRQLEEALMVELQVRTGLSGLIAAREASAAAAGAE